MKSFKQIALGVIIAVSAFGTVLYTSCTKDACKDVVCQNAGTCTDGKCTCPTGYEGTNCETKSRDKFVGTYVGTETCTVGTDAYSITLAANSDALKLTYTNLYNDNITATCTMTGLNTFSFSGTQGGATFSGTGTLSTNTLTVTYTLSNPTAVPSSNTCTFTGSK
ncbi:MAG: hypothetical protein JWQ38_596 [Flavipsychrobacter sp.]|nr:hypothetical protein [Flavipsychrobacter sp.]